MVHTLPAAFRLGTFSAPGGLPLPGLVIANKVYAVNAFHVIERDLGISLRDTHSTLGLLEHWDENLPALQAIADALAAALPVTTSILDQGATLEQLQTHAPIRPRQIFQAGANYHKHVVDLIVDGAIARDPATDAEQVRAGATQMMRKRAQSGKPFVFSGIHSSIIGPYDPIVVPYDVQQPDWELELAAVIGRPARRVPQSQALDYVAGYTIANDITSRDLVARPDTPQMGMDWMASKGSPTFLPIGPFITPAKFVVDPQALRITLKLNGQVMQDESTADMIFSVARIIEFISAHVQLLPGDLVLTGSPAGNGTHYNRFIRDGDLLEGEISGLGVQRNPCVAEPRPA
jgi:2-keto-4-pentenoate hydratase/2-oxohepta-3-ene-1,7-dioic acid hydratase in catechol pathway